MPEIMRQYGPTMVVAIAGAMLVGLLFAGWPTGGSGSVLEHVGASAATQLEGSTTGGGTQVFEGHAARKTPVASARGSVRQHETSLLTDAFRIVDSEGATWDSAARTFVAGGNSRGGSVWITSVLSPTGTELVGALTGIQKSPELTLVQTENGSRVGRATFHKPGIYRVRLRVMDGRNLEATYTIPLTVDLAKPAA